MENVYVLGIPDLQHVLSQEDIAAWELFLMTEEKRYERIRFLVSHENGCYTFKNVEACNGLLATVCIDFDSKEILFKGIGKDAAEFEDFLFSALAQFFVRVEKNRMQFMATSPKRRLKSLDTR